VADITMCQDATCPNREDCYRFVAIPDEHAQSWFSEKTLQPDGSCAFYMPIHRRNPK
jgi:hypothetical protein